MNGTGASKSFRNFLVFSSTGFQSNFRRQGGNDHGKDALSPENISSEQRI
jgi:hypothetical protein